MAQRRVGLWLIGACGGVGSTTALGLAALARGLTPPTGLVTALPQFAGLDLDAPASFVVGGHDIRRVGLLAAVRELHARSGVFDERQSLAELDPALDRAAPAALPTSSIYAFAAIDAGFPFVNLTPSRGATLPAVEELARKRRVPHAGQDLKTGETLLKSVLAPLFARRNLRVMSWVGHNILGNRDGLVLNDPENKASKVKSKDALLAELLGYRPQSLVSIEYVESLDDWKTAWDHIHFEGFLGTKMVLQFTWQGCDSILAAPLVLDLARLTLLAQRRGESGQWRHLACFFKSPMGVEGHNFFKQWNLLEQYLEKVASSQ